MNNNYGLQSLEIVRDGKSFLLPGIEGSEFFQLKDSEGNMIENPYKIKVTGSIPKSYRTEESVKHLKHLLGISGQMLLKICYKDAGLTKNVLSEVKAKIIDSSLETSIQSDGPNMVYFSIIFENTDHRVHSEDKKENDSVFSLPFLFPFDIKQ